MIPIQPPTPPEREWKAQGNKIEVPANRIIGAESIFADRYESALRHHNHLWIVTLCHFASDPMLDAFSGVEGAETPMLDSETIAMRPALGCFICETPYEQRIRNYKCTGEPR